ncbi:hypothetical protein BKA56DRAFT_621127 [Ilyonectria sp. MPI-CAGE-AT-0026]|nr:hypothetical protein BKA56DRAFT_621127 [Ilyonectria sp. MPI-CAGE-AT-0026]
MNAEFYPPLFETTGRICAGVHLEVSAAKLQQDFPHAEVIPIDLDDAAAVNELVQGVNAIYYVGPGCHPRETRLWLNMIDAAFAENMRSPDSIKHLCLPYLSSVHSSQQTN